MSLLQEYYLGKVGVKNVWFTNRPLHMNTDLFISLWGITEANMYDRSWVPENMGIDHALIAYANMWDNIDNSQWIRGNFKGKIFTMPHISGHLRLFLS
jgi:hypothetical protein